MENGYTVAETVKRTGVKSYVLRYWEEELGLHIGRTELGHRCYTEDDIQLFLNVKELKNRGLQLRAIRELLPKFAQEEVPAQIETQEEKYEEKNEAKEDKNGEKILEFQEILERLINQEIHSKKDGEERWRSLDEAIRKQQIARKEAAAALEKKRKRR